MEITVEHIGAVQFMINARGHQVVCDQPADNGGFDEGMTPPELLLASLGTCAGFYAVQYLKTHGLEQGGVRIRVSAEKAKAPARLASFRVEVTVPAALDEKHKAGVERAVHACLIHNTLLNPPEITLAIESPAAPAHAQ